MFRTVLVPVGLFALLATTAIIYSGRRFSDRLDAIASSLKQPAVPNARLELPPEVLALAERLGANPARPMRLSQIEELGQMWSAPDAAAMNFSARQSASTVETAFIWTAAAGPLGLIKVADYLANGTGGLEARFFGAFPVAKDVGSDQTVQGESMRYLAELPWNPDALLYNHSIQWTVLNSRQLRVAMGSGASRAEVILDLDDKGLVAAAGAEARPRLEGARYISRPWHGRFWDYSRVGGRMIPMSGEVAWTVEGANFVYWRGRITKWAAS